MGSYCMAPETKLSAHAVYLALPRRWSQQRTRRILLTRATPTLRVRAG